LLPPGNYRFSHPTGLRRITGIVQRNREGDAAIMSREVTLSGFNPILSKQIDQLKTLAAKKLIFPAVRKTEEEWFAPSSVLPLFCQGSSRCLWNALGMIYVRNNPIDE
jgi:hypothetical protein